MVTLRFKALIMPPVTVLFNTYGCYMSESWLSDAVFTSISETNITNPKRFCTKQFDYVYYENGELEYNFNM